MGQIEYSEDYVEKIFHMWFEGGRKQGNEFVNFIPTDHDGRKPSKFTIIDWVKTRGWVERADALSAEISREQDLTIINKRKKMFEEQEQIADELLEKGLAYLNAKDGGIKTDAAALRAIDLGLLTKRTVAGAAEAYVKISQMSDDQIEKELKKILGVPKKNEDNIIDVEPVDTESK